MEIRIEHTTDYPWDLLLLADPSRELVDCYLKTSDCFAAFSGDKPVGVIVVQKETEPAPADSGKRIILKEALF